MDDSAHATPQRVRVGVHRRVGLRWAVRRCLGRARLRPRRQCWTTRESTLNPVTSSCPCGAALAGGHSASWVPTFSRHSRSGCCCSRTGSSLVELALGAAVPGRRRCGSRSLAPCAQQPWSTTARSASAALRARRRDHHQSRRRLGAWLRCRVAGGADTGTVIGVIRRQIRWIAFGGSAPVSPRLFRFAYLGR